MKEVGALDPAGMADEELSDALVEIARLRSALEAAEVQLTASWDSRRVWAGDGTKSGSAWLARMTREPKAECGRRLSTTACGTEEGRGDGSDPSPPGNGPPPV